MKIKRGLVRAEVAKHPYPLLFATISGAHLYGFPSPDSDYDIRGAHILPREEFASLTPANETISVSGVREGTEVDLVTHDVHKFFTMLLKRNGYVLEQLYSPLIVVGGPAHAKLKRIAKGCITRHHNHHYLGFAQTQWKLFEKESPRRVKPLLYVYRVLLTGIHLMRTGEVQADLRRLNQKFRLSYVPELIERKVNGTEKGTLPGSEFQQHEREYARLLAELEAAGASSKLPEAPSAREQLNQLLLDLRFPQP